MIRKIVPAKLKGKKSSVIKNKNINIISRKLRKKKLVLIYFLVISEFLDKLNIIIIKIGNIINR